MQEINHKLKHCFNCDTELPTMENYCPNCGQKNTDGKPSFKELISEFFSSIFNLDSAFFKTMKHLFIPGKLTTAYFEGKRKRYTGPLRIFFVCAIIMIYCIARLFTSTGLSDSEILKDIDRPIDTDSLYQKIHTQHLNKNLDSTIIDSIITEIKNQQNPFGENDILYLNFIQNKDGKNVSFQIYDIMHLEEEELVEKYEIEDRFDVLIVHQISRLRKQPTMAVRFLLSNLVWMMILLMPALAFFFKFIYIRRKRFFVEHLVFLLHSHAVIFLIYALMFTIIEINERNSSIDISSGYGFLLPLAALLFFFLSIKFYYKQGWFKTFVKFILIITIYNILFLFFLLIMAMFSLIIF
jgi:hypothetical protein